MFSYIKNWIKVKMERNEYRVVLRQELYPGVYCMIQVDGVDWQKSLKNTVYYASELAKAFNCDKLSNLPFEIGITDKKNIHGTAWLYRVNNGVCELTDEILKYMG